MKMGFRFRLTFSHGTPGFFRLDDNSRSFSIDDTEFSLTARDTDKLSEATRFHIEARGFPTEDMARATGERLRLRLRVLNSLLGLGMSIPVIDAKSAQLADELKQKMARETGTTVLDSIIGLAVFPDDDKHLELVVAGRVDVYPSEPCYVFSALAQVWPIEMRFDERAEDALEILGRATAETSDRARFLLTYLAAERIVPRESRSEPARLLIEELRQRVRRAGLDNREVESLCGSLAQLTQHSFSSALIELAGRISSPSEIKGKPLRTFLSQCVTLRNKIAHQAVISDQMNIKELAEGLREFVMGLIWTNNRIPAVTIDVPPSTITIPEGGMRISFI
jgi:hypothetical protein